MSEEQNSSFNTSCKSLISEMTVLFESSEILQSSKYVDKKPKFTISFIKFAKENVLYSFIIKVTRIKAPDLFVGHDSSAYCLLKSEKKLAPNAKYIVYGRKRPREYCYIEGIKIEKLNEKELCYQIL